MNEETHKLNEWPSHTREQFEKFLLQITTGLQEITSQAFAARQGFYEKLILLNGATLTLLFTVIGGLSHAAITKEALNQVGLSLFIGCWLFIVSIMLSLLHNHLNIATLIHMTSSAKRMSIHGSLLMLGMSMQSAGITEGLTVDPSGDLEAPKDLKKGATTEKMCQWIGVVAQALTIMGYVALVMSLQTVIRALA